MRSAEENRVGPRQVGGMDLGGTNVLKSQTKDGRRKLKGALDMAIGCN